MNMLVTDHAKKRLKERAGLNSRGLARSAEIAFNKGICHSDCTGRLKRYVDYLFLSHKKGNNIRLYGDKVYIFHGISLLTVLNLPNMYHDAVNKLAKKKRNAAALADKED